MPKHAESSTAYRDRKEEEDDDDNLDDLDDVLASFNNPKPSARSASEPVAPPPPSSHAEPSSSQRSAAAGDDEDFEASLVEGMESLLRQLAGDNPPGPMPGSSSTTADKKPDTGGAMSAEEEEKAFQRAIEMMLSKEGIDALGLDDIEDEGKEGGERKPQVKKEPASPATSTLTSKPAPPPPSAASFEETIRKAMESLNAAGDKKPSAGGAGGVPSDPADLARLLAQLGNDPNLDLEGDDELSGILDGMMGQLMTREVLEEPMAELASKYPDYLASPPAGTPAADLEKYRQQHAIVQKIVDTFRRPGYSDDKDGKEVAKLVGEMQDLGGPPQEIMGDLPEGFDLGALAGGDESCCIM